MYFSVLQLEGINVFRLLELYFENILIGNTNMNCSRLYTPLHDETESYKCD